jgi:hypothetical protein
MDEQRVKEALEILQDPNSSERSLAFKTLKDLAQSYLALSGKVPEEKKHIAILFKGKVFPPDLSEGRTLEDWVNYGYNIGRSDALLAITALLDEKRLEKIILNQYTTNMSGSFEGIEEKKKIEAKILAQAIRTGIVGEEK